MREKHIKKSRFEATEAKVSKLEAVDSEREKTWQSGLGICRKGRDQRQL